MAGPNIGMDFDKLKQLLRLSKKEPVNCAVAGQTNDATMAFILLDKVKAPKAVSGMLDKENPKNFNLRWGTAVVDTDLDPKLVTFTLNKNVTGMAKKLKKTLKGTGYTKVVINFEDGTSESDLEDGETLPGGPTQTPTSGTSASPQTVADAQPSPGPSAETGGSTGTEAGTIPVAPPNPALTAKYQQSGKEWFVTRTNIEAQINKLKAEIAKTYQGQDVAAEIDKAYAAKVAPVMAAFDVSLVQKLAEASKAADGDAQLKLAGEARAIVTRYTQYVAKEPLLKDLDENPFTPLSIRGSVITTLKTLNEALK